MAEYAARKPVCFSKLSLHVFSDVQAANSTNTTTLYHLSEPDHSSLL